MKEHSSWKKSDSNRRSWWKRLNNPRSIDLNIDSAGRVVIVSLLIFLIFLGSAAAFYYSTPGLGLPGPCNPPNKIINGVCRNDPWTVIWNGEAAAGGTSIAFIVHANAPFATTTTSISAPSVGVQSGDLIFVSIHGNGGFCGFSVSDTVGNSFINQQCLNVGPSQITLSEWTVFSTATNANDVVTVGVIGGFSRIYGFDVDVWRNVQSIGENKIQGSTALGTSGSDVLALSNPQGTNDVLTADEFLYPGGVVCASTSLTTNGGIDTSGCETQSGNFERWIIDDHQICQPTCPKNSDTMTWSITGSPTGVGIVHYIMNMVGPSTSAINACPPGYVCHNARVDPNGELQLKWNNTIALDGITPIAISNATVDLSVLVGKSGSFNELFSNSAAMVSGNRPFGWFLTLNGTVPLTTFYNPLFDINVALVVVGYFKGNSVWNWYVYAQRQPTQQLVPDSGLGSDPFPKCPQSATLFMCAQTSMTGAGTSFPMSLILNYTGTGATIGNNGVSQLCTGPSGSTGANCSVGGSGYTIVTFTNGISQTTVLAPFLNAQQRYHVGFFQSVNQTSITVKNDLSSSNNIIAMFVPNANPTAPSSSTEPIGFFGWLGRTLGGAVSIVGSWAKTAATWVQDQALGPIASTLQAVFQWLINQLIAFLNLVGGLLGFPNLGTNLFNYLNGLVQAILNIAASIVSWISNASSFVLNVITLVIDITGAGFLGFLITYIVGPLKSLIDIVLAIVTIFFQYSVPASYLLAMDWIWGVVEVWRGGVPRFLAWVKVNIFIFTLTFKIFLMFVRYLWKIIVIVKSFIPTEGGTPAEVPAPIPSPSDVPGGGGE